MVFKKIISLILCCTLCFTSIITVYGEESVYESEMNTTISGILVTDPNEIQRLEQGLAQVSYNPSSDISSRGITEYIIAYFFRDQLRFRSKVEKRDAIGNKLTVRIIAAHENGLNTFKNVREKISYKIGDSWYQLGWHSAGDIMPGNTDTYKAYINPIPNGSIVGLLFDATATCDGKPLVVTSANIPLD